MKSTFLKISVFVLLFSFMGAGCKKDEEEDLSYLDEKTPLGVIMPGFAIYKTKKDYYFNVSVTSYDFGILCPELKENDPGITLYKNKFYYTRRFRLNDNYIASFEVGSNSYFTSLNYDEYIRQKLAPSYNQGLSNTKVINSIVDRDPFTEMYYSQKIINGKTEITIAEINQLIKEKNLEKYFTKIK